MATALELINGATSLIGVRAQGETLSASDAQEGLRRLNLLVNTQKTESLTVLAIERQIFDLTANQQQYSIGPGAEFNVPRPQSVNGAALLLNGLTSARSLTITRIGTTATGHLTAHGFSVGQEIYLAGCTDEAYNQSQIVLTVPGSTTFTFQVFGSPDSPAAGSPTVQAYSGVPTEIPRTVITDDAYQAIQLKTLTNAQFTNVYYNPTQPYGAIWLWPIPSTDANQLILYLQTQFAGFADLTTDYSYPDVPGYAEMLEYNLALRLASPFGRTVPPDIMDFARRSVGLVKRQNYKLSDLQIDPALTGNRMGGYNINTGNY